MKQEMVALILAGGRGSRLKSLTSNIAKPAVYFGGRYRIIDFVLSNVSNSGIQSVGIATQYEATALNNYIGSGRNWGLNGQGCLTSILPPRETTKGASWYAGTADAVRQNIDWLDKTGAEYLVILSGDHIYKMDYSDMLAFHKKNQADVTIAVQPVPLGEASRFGIMITDKDDRITEFQEKPKVPKSNLASMGIYIFSYPLLRQMLIDDSKDPSSSHDFGKDILPKMLNGGKRLFAYSFTGYWKDVGTVQSLWEANMDLLDPSCPLDLQSRDWRIYSMDTRSRPSYISPEAKVQDSLVNQGAIIRGEVRHSVISNEVTIEKGAVVTNSYLMPGTTVKAGVRIDYSLIGSKQVIDKDISGKPKDVLLVSVEDPEDY